jgi:predicted transcriptional regulator
MRGYPHKKILDFLIEQYDYEKDNFKKVHFSKIVKECRIGKNKAKEYFDFLIKKGLIDTRTDGYPDRKYLI